MILSIENHCSVKQQKTMANYMTTIFKDKLFKEAVDENGMCLPPLESLKEKILVKVRLIKIKRSDFPTHLYLGPGSLISLGRLACK